MFSLSNILLPGERISFQTKKSLIIFIMPAIWTALTLIFLTQTRQFIAGPALSLPFINSVADLAWLPGIIAVFSWLNKGLMYLTADFIVTNQRVILREGFFIRHSVITRLSAVAEIIVDQSLLGQVLHYGSITVNSFGGSNEVFSAINAPYEFQRKVATATANAGQGVQ